MKKLILIGLLFVQTLVFAQTPVVPSTMRIGDLKLKINSSARKKIQEDVNRLRNNDKYFQALVDKADMYFPIIEKAFKAEGVPVIFKYLAIQESAFKADAVSSSNAVGYWQFKGPTAVEVGMRVDNVIDERKNIAIASKGAATYLKRNNFKLDNWMYALISYNKGLGGVQSEVESKYLGAKTMDITSSTHWYGLKFLAHVVAFQYEVGKNAPGITLYEYDQGSGKTLDQIAKKLNVTTEEMMKYNLWISQSNKIPTDKTYVVIVPEIEGMSSVIIASGVDSQTSQTGVSANNNELVDFKTIKYEESGVGAVIAGNNETVGSLAIMGGLSLKKFRKYNDMESFDQIKPGQVYFLEKKKNKALVAFHTVRYGETLWDISQKYAIKSKKVMKYNRLRNEFLEEGWVLWLREERPEGEIEVDLRFMKSEEMTEEAQEEIEVIVEVIEVAGVAVEGLLEVNEKVVYHTVQAGETLYQIHIKYDVSVDDIKSWNNKTDNSLSVGEKLIVKK